MKTIRCLVLLIAALLAGLSACSPSLIPTTLPTQDPALATAALQTRVAEIVGLTQAAQTLQAGQTDSISAGQTDIANGVAGTLTALVTNTPEFTFTNAARLQHIVEGQLVRDALRIDAQGPRSNRIDLAPPEAGASAPILDDRRACAVADDLHRAGLSAMLELGELGLLGDVGPDLLVDGGERLRRGPLHLLETAGDPWTAEVVRTNETDERQRRWMA